MADQMDVKGLSDLIATATSLNKNMAALVVAINNVFPIGGATSASATAGTSGALPAQAKGYLAVTLPDGTAVKIPYYNP